VLSPSLLTFLYTIHSYSLLFITILILGVIFLFFLFCYPSKPFIGFADVMNFEPKIHNSLFNFINAFRFIYRGHPFYYTFIFMPSFHYSSRPYYFKSDVYTGFTSRVYKSSVDFLNTLIRLHFKEFILSSKVYQSRFFNLT